MFTILRVPISIIICIFRVYTYQQKSKLIKLSYVVKFFEFFSHRIIYCYRRDHLSIQNGSHRNRLCSKSNVIICCLMYENKLDPNITSNLVIVKMVSRVQDKYVGDRMYNSFKLSSFSLSLFNFIKELNKKLFEHCVCFFAFNIVTQNLFHQRNNRLYNERIINCTTQLFLRYSTEFGFNFIMYCLS